MKICFATNNAHKLEEIQNIVPQSIQLVTLKEVGCTEDIPETMPTIEQNSEQKARYVFDKYRVACFADDTGLEVEALNGEPGVLSARYAGEHGNAEKNMEKLLTALQGISNRKARFKTCITYINDKGECIQFTGIINGTISTEKRGGKGFGYDPVFVPDNYDISFAEMDSAEKNRISHRAVATNKLVEYFNKG